MDDFLQFEDLLVEPRPRRRGRLGPCPCDDDLPHAQRWERTPEGLLWEAEPETPSPVIAGICRDAVNLANRLRAEMDAAARNKEPYQPAIIRANARKKGARWINSISNRMLPILDRFTNPDLDRLNGCLNKVSGATGQETGPQQRLRAAIGRRLGIRT